MAHYLRTKPISLLNNTYTRGKIVNICSRQLVIALLVFVAGSANATVFYSARIAFEAGLDVSVTDDYSNPSYQFSQSNAVMSAIFGETDYTTTGFSNHNLVPSESYCAGCNGSFELGFTTTSVGTSNGVFGVGIDILRNVPSLPYDAFITFGDNSMLNYNLGVDGGFFGITSELLIRSIHFGLPNGGTTRGGSFSIDNLTIGSGTVPEPATLALFSIGLLGLGFMKRK